MSDLTVLRSAYGTNGEPSRLRIAQGRDCFVNSNVELFGSLS
jgi:hypothetical protein